MNRPNMRQIQALVESSSKSWFFHKPLILGIWPTYSRVVLYNTTAKDLLIQGLIFNIGYTSLEAYLDLTSESIE